MCSPTSFVFFHLLHHGSGYIDPRVSHSASSVLRVVRDAPLCLELSPFRSCCDPAPSRARRPNPLCWPTPRTAYLRLRLQSSPFATGPHIQGSVLHSPEPRCRSLRSPRACSCLLASSIFRGYICGVASDSGCCSSAGPLHVGMSSGGSRWVGSGTPLQSVSCSDFTTKRVPDCTYLLALVREVEQKYSRYFPSARTLPGSVVSWLSDSCDLPSCPERQAFGRIYRMSFTSMTSTEVFDDLC